MLPGLGGRTPPHGPWDGHAVIITSYNYHELFSVMGPIGGCTSHSGQLSQTSTNAIKNSCDVAVNGSPFTKGGGCIGQSISEGEEVCPDCHVWDGIPSLGLIAAASNNSTTLSAGMQSAAWVIGTGLNRAVAKSMGVSNLIVGHVPGWLVRNGTIIPPESATCTDGGVMAPRTAVGITGDGTTLILLVVDGCEHCPGFMGGPQGLTIHDLAVEMKKLGAAYAINLDGGGSSTLFYKGRVVNYPTSLDVVPIWRERRVSTVLCLRGL